MSKIKLSGISRIFKNFGESLARMRGFSIPISRPAGIVIGLIFVCAVGWAFFMGYMVGKGQNPEQGLHEISGLTKPDASEKPADESEATDIPIMPPTAQIPSQETETATALPFTKPQGNENEAWESPSHKTAPKKEAASQKVKPQQKPKKNEDRYTFTYQVAAFRTKSEADSLKAKLEKSAIRTQTRKDGRVFLVLASLRGTESEAIKMRKKIQDMKLGRPMLLSRKPVNSGKSAKK